MAQGAQAHSTHGAAEAADRTAALADVLATLDAAALPRATFERTMDLVVDHLGVALHGLDLPWSRIIAEFGAEEGGRPDATIYGRGRLPARTAALINGTMAHGIELDDTHDQSCSHPGAVVIPAALAVAEMTGASGRDLIAAIVAGYEAQTRAGAALTGDLMSRGFHPTALSGVFGAATAAGRLLGLTSAQMQSAWGLGVSMASGVMQFTQDPLGTMVKRLHAGIPAHNGVLAAMLAARGFQGPRGALDGRAGFVHVFSPRPEDWRLTQDLGTDFAVDRISIKFYACCRMFHALVDAIRSSREEAGWGADDVVEMTASGPRIMSDGHMEYRPRSVMSAQYSLPYTISAAVMLDPRDPRSFNAEAMARPDVLALADRVSAEASAELERYFPAKYPGGFTARLKDGRTIEKTLLDSFGTPEKPVDRAGITGKFRALTDGIVPPARADAILDAVFALGAARDVRGLADLLGEGVARG